MGSGVIQEHLTPDRLSIRGQPTGGPMIRLLIALTCLSAISVAGMYVIGGIHVTVTFGQKAKA